MKHAWRNGTAPTCTAEVPDFVEKHVHHNYILTAGVKSLPVHRHLLHVDKPTILRKPPHTVHKVLKGGAGGGATSSLSSSSSQTTRRARDRISGHPYKHAAAIASARRTDDPSLDDGGDHPDESSNRNMSLIPSLFGVAGVIGGPEFDPYQKYRHDIYPFKEQLAHEVNKLVLEKRHWMHYEKELLLPPLQLDISMMMVRTLMMMMKVAMVMVAKPIRWQMMMTTSVCCHRRQHW